MDEAQVRTIVDDRLDDRLGTLERAIMGERKAGARGILARLRTVEIFQRLLIAAVVVAEGARSWEAFFRS